MYNNYSDIELYKKMYYLLFNSITESLRLMSAGRPKDAADCLREAQQLAEDLYVSADNL